MRRVIHFLAKLAVLAASTYGLAEIAMRVLAASNPAVASIMNMQDPGAVKIEPFGEYGYRPRPGTRFPYRVGGVANENALGYRGPVVERPKPLGVRRVILLGGSSAHGWGVDDDQTIDAYLRRELASRTVGDSFEVVNLAFDGYDSWQDYERLRADGVTLEPDLVIVHSGINDVRNARFRDLKDADPRTMLWLGELRRQRAEQERGSPFLWTRLKQYSFVLRAGAHVRQEARRRRDPENLMHPADRVSVAPNYQAADYFQRNLERVMGLAGEQDIRLILSVPPSSLPTKYPPDARSAQSYWLNDAATTQAFRDTLATRMAMLAATASEAGAPVTLVRAQVPASGFFDDCHLRPDGNAAVARYLADSVLLLLGRSARWPPGSRPTL